jgi:serine/threonine protein kinase
VHVCACVRVPVLCPCQHSNIVRLIDVVSGSEHIYLVMDYCDGGDLSRLMKTRVRAGRSLPLHVIRVYFAQLCSGLSFMRSHHISHRDLKPENLLLHHGTPIPVPGAGAAANGKPTAPAAGAAPAATAAAPASKPNGTDAKQQMTPAAAQAAAMLSMSDLHEYPSVLKIGDFGFAKSVADNQVRTRRPPR